MESAGSQLHAAGFCRPLMRILVAKRAARSGLPIRAAPNAASLGRGSTLAPHRAPGVRDELPAPGDDHDQCGRDEQHPGTHEPAEITQRKEERALAAIEM